MIEQVQAKYGYTDQTWKALPGSDRRLLIGAYECDVVKAHEEPKGSNRGPHVEKYLKSVGLDGGFAWCAAFVNWCSKQADMPSGVYPKSPAMAASWLKWKPKPQKDVQRGDLGGFINKDGTGHVYLITKVHRNASGNVLSVDTIEGNSNDGGSREGWQVIRRNRAYSASMKFAN